MANRLAKETSPYLAQHAHNPVDWYPWGQEALEKARTTGKPIFLSIGYSACHWCHVMAHESFEDAQVAAVLNEHFVAIKVDREERPDLDQVYMAAVQAMTGGGGWPMSVFLTPEGLPFYAGTYFPPAPRHGLPSFRQVLEAVARGWRERRSELVASSQQVLAVLQQQQDNGMPTEEALRASTLAAAAARLQESFDDEHGGWGGAPKFPQPMALEFLLRRHHSTGESRLLAMVTQTLEAMARGGLYDQLGGGFHRYAVDGRWATPHFERMLYDNAQLARVYLHAWQVTGTPFFRTVTAEILDYVAHEMTDPRGGFFSTQDADSEGQEGRYYLWQPAEVRAVLGEEAERFMAAYGVSTAGNFDGQNILTLVGSLEERTALASARKKLLAVRRQRVPPGRDGKVLTSWNGLMLAAFAEAARVLHRDDYRCVAEKNAGFLLHEMRREDGRLWRTWQGGGGGGQRATGQVQGYLEDYTHLIEGLVELYQATFEPRWYAAARELAEIAIAHFRRPAGGFYDTSAEHESLVVRPRDLQDNATPSGNGMAAYVLPRLASLAVEPRYRELADESLRPMQALMARYPLGFGQGLIALDYLLAGPCEVAIVDTAGAGSTGELLRTAQSGYRPHLVVALGVTDAERQAIPLLQGRHPIAGRAAAYLCTGSTCRPPVGDPEALQALLDGV